MKHLFFLFVLACVAAISNAQELASISGRIVDRETQDPLPYATIIIYDQTGGTTISGGLSDVNGRFTITGLEVGQYVVNCTFMGYENEKLPILIGEMNNFYDLGKIEMLPSSQQLDEVMISARKEVVAAGLDTKTFKMKGTPKLCPTKIVSLSIKSS